MGTEWNEVSLENAMDAIIDYRGKTPKKTEYGIPLVTAKIVKNGRIEPTQEYIAETDYDAWMRRGIPQKGDVVLTTEAPLGEVAQLNGEKIALAQRIITLRGKDGLLESNFFLYLLQSNDVQHQLDGRASGTTVKGIKQSELRKIILKIPPLPEQKAIAHILGSLDDKIELNRQMNATLEGMAQALFKSWFVDFDPVIDNALAADNPIPDALAARAEVRRQVGESGRANREVAQAFPAAFQFTDELGWIPEGWKISSLKNCTSKIGSGATPRGGSEAYIEEGTRLVRSQNIHDSSFRWSGIVCITDAAATKLKGVTLTERDVLINITGDSILRSCAIDPSVLPARVNQHVAILRPLPDLPTHYLHQYIVRAEYKEYLLGFDAGGSRSAITKGHLEEARVLLPSQNVLTAFATISDSFFERKMENNSQTQNLAKLRDTLLPKLISGDLRVPDAEKLAAEVL